MKTFTILGENLWEIGRGNIFIPQRMPLRGGHNEFHGMDLRMKDMIALEYFHFYRRNTSNSDS